MDLEEKLHSCAELMEYIKEVGFLPLLPLGIRGWSAEEVMDEDCQYVKLPDGGYEWPLWDWKGDIIREIGCAYGKFICKKAVFISKEWWPDFCNWMLNLPIVKKHYSRFLWSVRHSSRRSLKSGVLIWVTKTPQ